MKKLIIGLLVFGSFSSFAKEVACSGKSFLKNYHVYLSDMSNDLSSAKLMVRQFKLGEHHGDYLVGPEFIYTKLPSSQENVLDIVSTETAPAPITGRIDLDTGKGNLKIKGFGIKRNIKLTNCRFI